MQVRLHDGAELFYTIDDYTDPWTQPETVVLHHGMAKNHRLWYGWVPILAQHYRVVRFDMRGMGQSSVPAPGYPWSLDNFARDLLGLMDQLELCQKSLTGTITITTITTAISITNPTSPNRHHHRCQKPSLLLSLFHYYLIINTIITLLPHR